MLIRSTLHRLYNVRRFRAFLIFEIIFFLLTIFIALAVCSAHNIYAQSALTGQIVFFSTPVGAEKVPILASPSPDSYRTGVLERNDRVEIYFCDKNGYCAIKPPKGSFSWINGKFLELESSSTGHILSNNGKAIPSRVGGDSPATSSVVQIGLQNAQKVKVMEKLVLDDGSEWYKIAPPPGEFRWIHKDYLDDKVIVDELPNKPTLQEEYLANLEKKDAERQAQDLREEELNAQEFELSLSESAESAETENMELAEEERSQNAQYDKEYKLEVAQLNSDVFQALQDNSCSNEMLESLVLRAEELFDAAPNDEDRFMVQSIYSILKKTQKERINASKPVESQFSGAQNQSAPNVQQRQNNQANSSVPPQVSNNLAFSNIPQGMNNFAPQNASQGMNNIALPNASQGMNNFVFPYVPQGMNNVVNPNALQGANNFAIPNGSLRADNLYQSYENGQLNMAKSADGNIPFSTLPTNGFASDVNGWTAVVPNAQSSPNVAMPNNGSNTFVDQNGICWLMPNGVGLPTSQPQTSQSLPYQQGAPVFQPNAQLTPNNGGLAVNNLTQGTVAGNATQSKPARSRMNFAFSNITSQNKAKAKKNQTKKTPSTAPKMESSLANLPIFAQAQAAKAGMIVLPSNYEIPDGSILAQVRASQAETSLIASANKNNATQPAPVLDITELASNAVGKDNKANAASALQGAVAGLQPQPQSSSEVAVFAQTLNNAPNAIQNGATPMSAGIAQASNVSVASQQNPNKIRQTNSFVPIAVGNQNGFEAVGMLTAIAGAPFDAPKYALFEQTGDAFHIVAYLEAPRNMGLDRFIGRRVGVKGSVGALKTNDGAQKLIVVSSVVPQN